MTNDQMKGTILRVITPERANEAINKFARALETANVVQTNEWVKTADAARAELFELLVGQMERVTIKDGE